MRRFLNWISARPIDDQLAVFFTPWGEALIHRRYQAALAELSHLQQITKVAIQTNLACSLNWVDDCAKEKIGLWTTYHPGETDRERFLEKCKFLSEHKVRYSVGIVGLKEHIHEISGMRKALPEEIYLWINAYKREANYYSAEDLQRLQAIDPLFYLNNQYHASLGRACHCGASVISVDGHGTARRCHFIKTVIGNIYEPGFEQALRRTPCTAATCGCFIGYVHMDSLNLYETFADGVLERIPSSLVMH